MILRIPVLEDGTAGPAEIVAGTEACVFDELFGLDGIAFDVHGMIYAANVIQSTLLKINPHVSPAVVDQLLGPEDGLHDPASVAFGTGKKHRKTLFISNYAVFPPWDPVNTKGPAILKYDVGVPGLPLP
jgi:sugar lactone lactonase YvrE